MNWIGIDEAAARDHPLYGFGGWLGFFGICFALGLLSAGIAAFQTWTAADALAPLAPLAPVLLKPNVVLGVVVCSWLFWCFARRDRRFRYVFPAASLALTLIDAAVTWAYVEHVRSVNAVVGDALVAKRGEYVAQAVVTLAAVAALSLYMHRSRRFRVTFEHKVRGSGIDMAMPGPPGVRPATNEN